tara:strand:- start:718 stop:1209 length:492 start_codon:yes stop_codon:yes gene_type:complete
MSKSSYTGTRWIIENNEWIPIKWGPKQLVHWVPSKVGWDVDTIQSESTVDMTVKRHINLLNHIEEFFKPAGEWKNEPKKIPKTDAGWRAYFKSKWYQQKGIPQDEPVNQTTNIYEGASEEDYGYEIDAYYDYDSLSDNEIEAMQRDVDWYVMDQTCPFDGGKW